MRALKRFLEHSLVQNLIIALIIVNAIILGFETWPPIASQYGSILSVLDRALLVIFVVELSLRLVAYRLSFFRDPWNIFDFVVIGIALLPATGGLSALRALRILRALRLVSMIPSMKRVVAALLSALPGMASIITLLLLVQYVAAVIATKLYAGISPEFFGDILKSAFTLFQIMTLEGWADIARDIMVHQPYAWLFFLVYILSSTFTVLNLFIGVVVNAMQEQLGEEVKAEHSEDVAREQAHFGLLLEEIKQLRAELSAIRVERQSPP